jgi:hypothetical protein
MGRLPRLHFLVIVSREIAMSRSRTGIKGATALVVLAGLGVAVGALALPPSSSAAPPLVVHQWGAILSVQGPDGVGLGPNDLPLRVTEAAPVRTDLFPRLILENTSDEPLPAVFAVRQKNGRLSWTALGALGAKQTRIVRDMHGSGERDAFGVEPILTEWASPKEGVCGVTKAVTKSLVQAGLSRKEAGALMDAWGASFFGADGLRFLFVMPRSAVDRALPVGVSPRPDELVRVMVGQVEALTMDGVRQLEEAVRATASGTAPVRAKGEAALGRLGGLREIVLSRIAVLTYDPEVKAQVTKLLKGKARD